MTRIFAATHVRTTDPDTSHNAAASVEKPASAICERILGIITRVGRPLAVEEVLEYAGDLTKDQVWRRMSDLKNAGKIVDSGLRHRNANGRTAAKWQRARADFALEG